MAALSAPVLGGKGKVALDAAVFETEMNVHLLHQVVKAEFAEVRQGTHATRTRGNVRGGASKPWRQKGTGRARQGTIRAPQFAGGGVVFGPSPRSYKVKVNKKERSKALRIALGQHAALSSVRVFDASKFESPKTREAIALLDGWKDAQLPLLVVVDDDELAAGLSFRNLPRTLVATPLEIGAAELLWARSLLISSAALELLQGGGAGDEEAAS